MQDLYEGGSIAMFILDQLYITKNTPFSVTDSLENLKAEHTKSVFLMLSGHHFAPTGPQTQLSEAREHLLTSTDTRTNPQIPISATH